MSNNLKFVLFGRRNIEEVQEEEKTLSSGDPEEASFLDTQGLLSLGFMLRWIVHQKVNHSREREEVDRSC